MSKPFRTLAIDPTKSGFAFVVLEGSEHLVDWGVAKVFAESEEAFLVRLDGFIARYQPDALILEGEEKSRRPQRVRRLLDAATWFTTAKDILVVPVTGRQVDRAFPAAASKWDRADELVKRFPELLPRLPVRRKPWMSEDERINIFDALSFALTALAALEDQAAA